MLGLILAAGAAGAQPPGPLEDDFQVNSYTTSFQGLPAVTTAPGGEFLVVWQSVGSEGTDGDGSSIQFRRLAADGTPLGQDLQVNTVTSGSQGDPTVAAVSDGSFLVVWDSEASTGNDNSGRSVQGRWFDPVGNPLGDDFQVNTVTTGWQSHPAVAAQPGGDFVVVWESGSSAGDDSDGYSIQARRFASDGTPLGDDFQLNTLTTANQARPAVAVRADGEFLVVWQSGTLNVRDVRGRRFTASGAPLGADFQIQSGGSGLLERPAVAMAPAGDALVMWARVFDLAAHPLGSDKQILGRTLAADGTPLGDDFQINSFDGGNQVVPQGAVAGSGAIVAVWGSGQSAGSDGSLFSIQARGLEADGTPIGHDFQVNTYTLSHQDEPVLAFGLDDLLLVLWQSNGSGGDDTDFSVQARRFSFDTILADGFESGDVAAWARASP